MDNTLGDLVVASRFAKNGLFGPQYHFPDSLAQAIHLSEMGERRLAEVAPVFRRVPKGDISVAFLACLAADDALLISAELSDLDDVFRILSKEIYDRHINYPLVFGRDLHDQFTENFGASPIERLTPEETQRLAALTPQGVFQMREWVCGPLGLVKSSGCRYLPPQDCGPAIRCKRISCNNLHHVRMKTFESDSARVRNYITKRHPLSVGFAEGITSILVTGDEFFRVNHPGGLPWLIGNGFTYEELSRLVEVTLTDNVDNLRVRVNKLLGGSTSRRPPSAIVGLFTHAALVQLLLLLDDVSLVQALEAAIDNSIITLSSTEVRYSIDNWHIRGGYFKAVAEASRLGVRFVPRNPNLTGPRMLAAIDSIFSGSYQNELSWQLRNEPGIDIMEKLERCLEQQDPRQLLNRLLFSSQQTLERAFDVLEFGRFAIPATIDAEESLVEKILWKLGSPLPTPKVPYAPLEQHLSKLMASTATEYADEEARVTAIRSVGMNMFVELESLLQHTSQFACWALLNDHYAVHPLDRFRYSRKRADDFARSVFRNAAAELGDAFPYNSTNGNVLSVLISSFRILADICESRLKDAESYTRQDKRIPAFTGHSDVQRFPLLHTVLFLDLRLDSQRRLTESLRSAALSLTRTDICALRNGLGHPREKFPSNDRLTEAVGAIRNAIAALAAVGMMPIIRKYAGEDIDGFNRRQIRMIDGSGDVVTLTAPNQLMMLDLPSYGVAQVVLQDALFVGSLQPARFEVADDSEWAELWHGVGLIDSWLGSGEAMVITEGPSSEDGTLQDTTAADISSKSEM